ncbi:hypothetical protein CR513_56230, partial [Mucuna pruriens]
MLEAMCQKQNTPIMIFVIINLQLHFQKTQFFIGELVLEKVVIEYYPTEEQVADIFRKPMKTELFYKLKKMFGIINVHT